MYQLAQTC